MDMSRNLRALLVCSPGGHLQQMLALEPAWRGADVTWVTLRSRDVEHLLAAGEVVYGRGPTNRSIFNFLRNLPLAWRTIRAVRPDAILSTGAGLAVPFFLIGRLLGCRLVYVESMTRTETISTSGRLVYPLAHQFFVQWPGAVRRRRMRFVGRIL
jgi:beta-1,4-N-acetylglucosaminyltransferase